jgi:hypothetical protein
VLLPPLLLAPSVVFIVPASLALIASFVSFQLSSSAFPVLFLVLISQLFAFRLQPIAIF